MEQKTIYEKKGRIEMPVLNTKFTLEAIRQDNELWKVNILDKNTGETKEVSDDTSTVILKLVSSLYLNHTIEFSK